MIETVIPNTGEYYPSGYWDILREKAESYSEKLRTCGLSAYAERVAHCSDVIESNRTANGFLVYSAARFCRVRGCPICEWRSQLRKLAMIYPSINKLQWLHNEESPGNRIALFSFTKRLAIADIPSETGEFNKELLKFRERKAFERVVSGGFTSNHIEFLPGQSDCIFTGLCFCLGNTRLYDGRNALTLKSVQSEWNDYECSKSHGRLNTNKITDLATILREATPVINYSNCKNSEFPSLFTALLNRRMYRTYGNLKKTSAKIDRQRGKDEKQYHPSELKQIKKMQRVFHAFLPDPESDSEVNRYQEYPHNPYLDLLV